MYKHQSEYAESIFEVKIHLGPKIAKIQFFIFLWVRTLEKVKIHFALRTPYNARLRALSGQKRPKPGSISQDTLLNFDEFLRSSNKPKIAPLQSVFFTTDEHGS